MIGITAAGAYVPRNRLSRAKILEANRWFNPGLRAQAKGERAICNWDEDSLTMAVEAGRDALAGRERSDIGRLILASTTAPFADRQNAGIAAEALNLRGDIAAMDVGGSLRAGTSALAAALLGPAVDGETLVLASDRRLAKAASSQEMSYGDAAAAVCIGASGIIAELIGAHSVSADFVDHYRGADRRFDYAWEERWVRDEGHLKIMPAAIADALSRAGVGAGEVTRFLVPLAQATAARLGKQLGIAAEAVSDNLFGPLGDAGAAHPLILLIAALEQAQPGETILLTGWGQGCDVLILRTTSAIAERTRGLGVSGHLASGRPDENYSRYLAINGLIEQERGIRSELDKQTPVSALYRNKDTVLGFIGGKCRECGTVQFPRTNVCVNPNCGKFHSQDPLPMADADAHIQSWTADNLTYSPDPPNHFGMIVFDEGGRLMSDITDVDPGSLDVGMKVQMMFRIKDFDDNRGFRRYFWKAAPPREARADER